MTTIDRLLSILPRIFTIQFMVLIVVGLAVCCAFHVLNK